MTTPDRPPETASQPGSEQPPRPDGRRRPLIERLGMGAIAVLMAGMFGFVAAAAFVGGEVFLATMAAIGAVMTLWVGTITVLRG